MYNSKKNSVLIRFFYSLKGTRASRLRLHNLSIFVASRNPGIPGYIGPIDFSGYLDKEPSGYVARGICSAFENGIKRCVSAFRAIPSEHVQSLFVGLGFWVFPMEKNYLIIFLYKKVYEDHYDILDVGKMLLFISEMCDFLARSSEMIIVFISKIVWWMFFFRNFIKVHVFSLQCSFYIYFFEFMSSPCESRIRDGEKWKLPSLHRKYNTFILWREIYCVCMYMLLCVWQCFPNILLSDIPWVS